MWFDYYCFLSDAHSTGAHVVFRVIMRSCVCTFFKSPRVPSRFVNIMQIYFHWFIDKDFSSFRGVVY